MHGLANTLADTVGDDQDHPLYSLFVTSVSVHSFKPPGWLPPGRP
jgi:hypothetical protein